MVQTRPGLEAEVRQFAHEMAQAGIPVFPLRPDCKEPAIARWPERATVNHRSIGGYFRDGNRRNLAGRTGAGIVIIDVDPRNGGEASFFTLAAELGATPRTATARTGGGGFHYVFRVPEGIRVRCRNSIRPGIDVKGERGYVVLPPSIHPDTGKAYCWIHHPKDGIAELPAAWIEALAGTRDAERRKPWKSVEVGGRPSPARTGDAANLATAMIDRFPIPGPGNRHDFMVRAIGHLAGKGYDDATITDTIRAWTDYHHRLGLCLTDPGAGTVEATATLHTTRSNPGFAMAISGIDHRARCREISIPRTTPAPSPLQIHCVRGTPINGRFCDLYPSLDEVAFVDALSAYVAHLIEEKLLTPDGTVLATNVFLRQVARDRSGVDWTVQQFERLKRKFVSRPDDGKMATRRELLLEVRKGVKKPGEATGTPSEYRLTGLLDLIPDLLELLLHPGAPSGKIGLVTTGP